MKRRNFFKNTLAGGALLGGAGIGASSCGTQQQAQAPEPRVYTKQPRKMVQIQENGKYDYLLKGGHVIDPKNNINSPMDVAVAGGKIALVGKDIPATDAKRTFDVSGLHVTPGLIDIHVHCFHTFNVLKGVRSVNAEDLCLPYGVTKTVDVGTSGAESFEDFKKLIDISRVRVLALLNIAAPGMTESEQDPRTFKVEPMVRLAKKYPETIVGFKTAHYMTRGNLDKSHPPWASIDALIEAGEKANLPVMIHSEPRTPSDGFPERSFRELVMEKMRPGDIHTHIFAPAYHVGEYMGEQGRINPDMIKAQERGVIFDVGHGAGSCTFRNAVPAIQQGFVPNSISTDLYGANSSSVVLNMINVMSKFLNMGLSLEQIIRLSTINPANEINRPELGHLSVGSIADIAVIEQRKGNFTYCDIRGGVIRGDKLIQCVLTFFGGRPIFDPYGFNSLLWDDNPKDSPYWKSPNEQYW